MSSPDNDNGPVGTRLTAIESLLNQVLEELRGRKRRAGKRVRSRRTRVLAQALRDPEIQPTELQRAAARRALARIEARKQGQRS